MLSRTLLTAALCATLTAAVPAHRAHAHHSRSLPTYTAAAAMASSSTSDYWFADMDHSLDTVWQNPTSGYVVWRDVTAYGAAGDGVTDDTAAINEAMSAQGRCGGSAGACDSSTITPAIVYFPPGNYSISGPITMYYYTQMIGDPNDMPTIVATPNFSGMAMIDADPYDYDAGGANWYTNQNNFFRQVRNFNIDVRPWSSGTAGAGIHWQVAQATSLQNINFYMGDGQEGIFMDNGSGGFFSDLTFYGGKYGAFLGSQQFTTRNLTFVDCDTAIYMNWNWGWTIHGVTITGGTTGIDMSNSPTNQTVGSVIVADSSISGATYGVRFAYQNSASNVPATGGTLFLDNVDMSGTPNAVVNADNSTILAGNTVISAWAAGHAYSGTAAVSNSDTVMSPMLQQGTVTPPTKASSLLDPTTSAIFARLRPQYESLSSSEFLTAKGDGGCAGDGSTDDTAKLQAFLNQAASENKVAYFEHGAYLVSNTILVPSTLRITGCIWPLIMADGSSTAFSDASNPKPVFQVGNASSTSGSGAVEISDLIFQTKGAAPGAIMIEWNLNSAQGASGMWDSHVRIGGTAGTGLEGPAGLGGCANNTATYTGPGNCEGVFLMFHATKASSGVYLENTWFWVADHDLDNNAPNQVSIYSGRGMLIESTGPVWLWGTAAEHSALYNYQFISVSALFAGFMQSETPYYQPNPLAPTPFAFNENYDDPLFTICANGSNAGSTPCKDAWGLRVVDSSNVLIYGTGLYSFFQNYGQTCVGNQNCQQNMIHIQNSAVDMYAVSTKAAINMLVDDTYGSITDADNRDNFCGTIVSYTASQ